MEEEKSGDEENDVEMADAERGDDEEVAQAEGDAAAPGDLDGAILDPFLDLFVEDEGGDLGDAEAAVQTGVDKLVSAESAFVALKADGGPPTSCRLPQPCFVAKPSLLGFRPPIFHRTVRNPLVIYRRVRLKAGEKSV